MGSCLKLLTLSSLSVYSISLFPSLYPIPIPVNVCVAWNVCLELEKYLSFESYLFERPSSLLSSLWRAQTPIKGSQSIWWILHPILNQFQKRKILLGWGRETKRWFFICFSWGYTSIWHRSFILIFASLFPLFPPLSLSLFLFLSFQIDDLVQTSFFFLLHFSLPSCIAYSLWMEAANYGVKITLKAIGLRNGVKRDAKGYHECLSTFL